MPAFAVLRKNISWFLEKEFCGVFLPLGWWKTEGFHILFVKSGIIVEAAFQGGHGGRFSGGDLVVGVDEALFDDEFVDGNVHFFFKNVSQGGNGHIALRGNFGDQDLFIQIPVDVVGSPADKVGLEIFFGGQLMLALQGTEQNGQHGPQQLGCFGIRLVAGGNELTEQITDLLVAVQGRNPVQIPGDQPGIFLAVRKLQQTPVIALLISVNDHLVIGFLGDDDQGFRG